MTKRRRWVVGALLTAALTSTGAPASAATLCVGDPQCGLLEQFPTLIDAALAATLLDGPDIVRLGPGAHAGGAFLAGNPVELVGAGRGVTTLEAAPLSTVALEVLDPASKVRGLTVRVPDVDGAVGLRLAGTAEDVAVSPASLATSRATGVALLDAGVLRLAGVESPTGASSWAVDTEPGARAAVDQVGTLGGGLRVRGASLAVTRSRVDAVTGPAVLAAEGGQARVDSSVVRSLAGSPSGLSAEMSTAGSAVLHARHVTLIGGGGDGLAARASGTDAVARVEVDDSIVRGFSHDRNAEDDTVGDASIVVRYSNFDPSTDDLDPGTGSLSLFDDGTNRTYGTIRFLDAATGDYRLRGTSPVIDRGTPGGLLSDDSPLDLDGFPRVVDGNGAAGATRDMGAYEYQRRPPALTANAQPALAPVGTPIHFEAQVSDPDPGDEVTVRWVFDDGGVWDGTVGEYAFSTPGAHSATVTATDSAGAETTRTVLVRAVPPAPAVAAAVPVLDVTAPRLEFGDKTTLKGDRRGRVSVRVRCAAGEPEPCRGTMLLQSFYPVTTRPSGSRAQPSRVTLATAPFVVPAGQQRTLRPRLRAVATRLLRRTGRLRVRVQLDARDTAGNRRTVRKAFTLRAPENARPSQGR